MRYASCINCIYNTSEPCAYDIHGTGACVRFPIVEKSPVTQVVWNDCSIPIDKDHYEAIKSLGDHVLVKYRFHDSAPEVGLLQVRHRGRFYIVDLDGEHLWQYFDHHTIVAYSKLNC